MCVGPIRDSEVYGLAPIIGLSLEEKPRWSSLVIYILHAYMDKYNICMYI